MVEVDLGPAANPFVKASTKEKRLKLLLWGPLASRKTRLSLQFPSPIVLDLEAGTDFYKDEFDFGVPADPITSSEDVWGLVRWLQAHDHPYRTIVIDPFTILWEMIQKRWHDIFLKRETSSKGNRFDYYNFQGRDWRHPKNELKQLIWVLNNELDMNVIATAREKDLYAASSGTGGGDFMQVVAEKSLGYYFDTVLHVWQDPETKKTFGEVDKDRSNRLPQSGQFEVTYQALETLLGKQELGRKAKPAEKATDEQKAELEALFARHGFDADAVRDRLRTYGASGLNDLSRPAAEQILSKIKAAGAGS